MGDVNMGTPAIHMPMSALESRHRRFLRGPDGHEGLPNQGGTPAGTGQPPQNNTGAPPQFQADKFWDDPQEAPQPSPQGNGGGGEGPADPLANIFKGLESATFKPFMTADVVNGMGENNFDTFNKGLDDFGRQLLTQSAQVQTQILQQVVPAILAHVQSLVNGTLEGKDSNAFLESNIAAAKDPATAPMVKSVFDRALQIHKGNRAEALKTTKLMLQTLGNNIAGDVDLTIPPGAGNSPPANQDWFKELGIPLSRT